MKRTLLFIYGILCYLLFLGTYLYFIAFVGDIFVPKTVDSGAPGPLHSALIIDFLLITLFALQHSVMARKSFKRRWTRIIPKSIERSTYVAFSSIALIILIWQWRPIPEVIWSVDNTFVSTILYVLYGAGFALAILSSFLIQHFELFGLQQVYRQWRQKAFNPPPFQMPWLYRIVRHPLQTGQMIGLWAIPTMTAGHLFLAFGMTAYILIGIYFEERDLVRTFGQKYIDYREETYKLIPGVL
jgi:protein-S-isoprenylcysteine O-methyltransferase Ste14